MRHIVLIPNKERTSNWYFELNFYYKWEMMDVDDVCVLRARKDHNHSYYLEFFFYDTQKLGFMTFTSKKELYCAIQKLLEKNIK